MRKLFLLSLVAVLVLLNGASLTLAQADAWVCPEGFEGQTLRVFNWTTYVAEDTIPNFEAACDVKVEYFEYGSSEEAVNVIRTGSAQYDIVVPSGNSVTVMINEELLQPLDHSKIPNLANLLPTFVDNPHDPGNAYSVPYQWGSIGIGYDATVVDEPIESWADFFAYEGRVAWLDDYRAVLGVGLLLLGYDPNSTDADEIAEAADYLLGINAGDVFQIAPDTGQDLLVRGEVDATIEYSGDIFQILDECECDDYVYVIPEEGAVLWTDNMVIPASAPNPDLAHAFIDYILDAQVGADLSNYIAYGSPNAASIPLLDEELRENPGIYPSDETLEKSFVAIAVGEAERFYSEAWNKINAELGGN